MNLITDLESELAYAVLIEKKHVEKLCSDEVLTLIRRLNDALESASAKTPASEPRPVGGKKANSVSH